MPNPAPLIRIGELARRAGIPAATLRVWERRYGIVEPQRTEAGYRLYSAEDERRLGAMVELISSGVAPAEAAQQVTAAARAGAGGEPFVKRSGDGAAPVGAVREELIAALHSFDQAGAHRALDRGIAAYSIEALIGEVVIPVLRETGRLWSEAEAREGAVSVGQEHFASSLLRGRLLALARDWGAGDGPPALLACPPGEQHDLGLICLGLLLRQGGWRITMLGCDTPLETVAAAAERTDPELIVLAVNSGAAAAALSEAGPLELGAPALIGGAAATADLAAALGAELLGGDIVAIAGQIADRSG